MGSFDFVPGHRRDLDSRWIASSHVLTWQISTESSCHLHRTNHLLGNVSGVGRVIFGGLHTRYDEVNLGVVQRLARLAALQLRTMASSVVLGATLRTVKSSPNCMFILPSYFLTCSQLLQTNEQAYCLYQTPGVRKRPLRRLCRTSWG